MAKGKMLKNLVTSLGGVFSAKPKAAIKGVTNVVTEAGAAKVVKNMPQLGSVGTSARNIPNLVDTPVIRGKPIREALSGFTTSAIKGGTKAAPLLAIGGLTYAGGKAYTDIKQDISKTDAQIWQENQNDIDKDAMVNQSGLIDLNERYAEFLANVGQFNTDPNSPSAYSPNNMFTLPSQDQTEANAGGSGVGSLLIGAALIGGGYYAYKKFYKKGGKK